jgi:ATP adenylyltransferase
MAYIGGEQPQGCIFCTKPDEERDAANYIVARAEHAFVMLNAFPYNSGHLLIIPYRHVADYTQLREEELLDLGRLTQQGLAALSRAFHPDGHNVGMNLGAPAGAGIADHVHLHIVPRWSGDTNFMPVLADVKVLPEALAETFRKLREAWEKP